MVPPVSSSVIKESILLQSSLELFISRAIPFFKDLKRKVCKTSHCDHLLRVREIYLAFIFKVFLSGLVSQADHMTLLIDSDQAHACRSKGTLGRSLIPL